MKYSIEDLFEEVTDDFGNTKVVAKGHAKKTEIIHGNDMLNCLLLTIDVDLKWHNIKSKDGTVFFYISKQLEKYNCFIYEYDELLYLDKIESIKELCNFRSRHIQIGLIADELISVILYRNYEYWKWDVNNESVEYVLTMLNEIFNGEFINKGLYKIHDEFAKDSFSSIMYSENYRNLLFETLITIIKNGYREKDIRWVGKQSPYEIKTISYTSWEHFKSIARFEYDAGYGANLICSNLIIAGDDWWLSRAGYDGNEYWDFNRMPEKPLVRCDYRREDILQDL